jgi:KDO2-lipid IV(A) lauroyltransferase
MAKKPRKPLQDYAVYLAVRLVVCVIQAVPLRVALGFANSLAWLMYMVDKRHREVARDNLRHAFPDRCANAAECDRLVRACYRHYCTVMIEIACIPRRIHIHNWRKAIKIHRFGELVRYILGDRPVLLVTAHFGNWEIAGYMTGVVGLRTFAIARVLDNPHLHKFLLWFRQKTGQTILNKSGDFDKITAVLQAGRVISTLGDQDAGPKGLFVDFFNRPASTHKAVALLSLQFDAPMVVVGIPRIGTPMKFVCWVEDIIDPRDYATSRGTAVRAITERFTQATERMVRMYPEQYFWLHRRWKHEPPKPKSKDAKPADDAGQTAIAESQ